MFRVALIAMLMTAFGSVRAQLPPDAVDLSKVNISEKYKPENLDPVTLEPADPSFPTWEHDGVKYGSSKADSTEKFMASPDKFAERFEKERWKANFVQSMSTIWCPVTDEITTGSGLVWNELGLRWESCCQFCNESKTPEDFPRALDRLEKRGEDAFALQSGRYVEGKGPVDGAIDLGGGAESGSGEQEIVPAWLQGAELQPTLGEGVGLIFQNRCIECHRPMGAAPMPFTTRGEIGKWTAKMKEHIEMGMMPPWPASSANFSNSKRLTAKEKEVMLKWIADKYAPGATEWKAQLSEWQIGEPDHVFTLEAHTIPEDVGENVFERVVETSFDEDKYIVAAEVRPTDTFLVLSIDAGPLGRYLPGNSSVTWPEGSAYLLKKGEKITVRTFYVKEAGWEETDDNSQIAVKFAARPAGVTKTVLTTRAANDSFTIPAGKEQDASAGYTMAEDGFIHAVTPVLRQRGKSVIVTAKLPAGDEKELLNIAHWDPMLNFSYQLAAPLEAPKGTVITVKAKYDNTTMNAKNPDASADVPAGPGGELLENWIDYSIK
ncbi:MAG: cytochrome c [Candidatus Hydrogenedentota bacterium]